jgi:hypothetical protein
VRLAFILANVLNARHRIVLLGGILLRHKLFIVSNNHTNKQARHTIIHYKIVLELDKFRKKNQVIQSSDEGDIEFSVSAVLKFRKCTSEERDVGLLF